MSEVKKPRVYSFIMEKKSVLEYSKASEAYYDQELTKKDSELSTYKRTLEALNQAIAEKDGRISYLESSRKGYREKCFKLEKENDILKQRLDGKNEAIKQIHKDYGCEVSDPNGTIWEQCAKVQKENEVLKKHIEDCADEGNLISEIKLGREHNAKCAYFFVGESCFEHCNCGLKDEVINTAMRISTHIKKGLEK